jgi:hypothetical protein
MNGKPLVNGIVGCDGGFGLRCVCFFARDFILSLIFLFRLFLLMRIIPLYVCSFGLLSNRFFAHNTKVEICIRVGTFQGTMKQLTRKLTRKIGRNGQFSISLLKNGTLLGGNFQGEITDGPKW